MLLFLTSGRRNPIELLFANERIKDVINKKLDEFDICIFLPFIGIVPVELIETFPFSQYVFSNIISHDLIELVNTNVEKFIKENNYESISLCYIDKRGEFIDHMTRIEDSIRKMVKNTSIIDFKNI